MYVCAATHRTIFDFATYCYYKGVGRLVFAAHQKRCLGNKNIRIQGKYKQDVADSRQRSESNRVNNRTT